MKIRFFLPILCLMPLGLFGQFPSPVSMQTSAASGTSLGANNTISSNGISLGNRVKMRGFVDFRFDYTDIDINGTEDKRFRTSADIDFLIDFSPVTAELHTTASSDGVDLEQAFFRYGFSPDFSLTAGRQLTALSFEKDESPDMYQTSYAYLTDVASDVQGGESALQQFIGLDAFSGSGFNLPKFRRNYVDGIRANFNNGQFGLVAGLYNGYFTESDNLNDGNIGLDIAASVMIIPGLEFRLGYAYENSDHYNDTIVAATAGTFPESDEITQFNAWLSYETGPLTLAMEWDLWDIYVIDMWNVMLLANYQFNDFFALTLRYSHEDFEADVPGGGEGDSDRFTIGPVFSVTDYLTVGIEYSHAELESTNTGETSVDELYAETIFSF